MSSQAALALAEEQNMDLVLIAPQAKPPACRIMDYGKYVFEQAKREKEARRNSRVIEVKEVRLSPNIDTNDLNTKLNHAISFLKSGAKVKVTVRFRGREVTHSSLGENLLVRFAEGVSEYGQVEKKPKLEGRFMSMFIHPKVAK
jgi:translation initiation factor IF-3